MTYLFTKAYCEFLCAIILHHLHYYPVNFKTEAMVDLDTTVELSQGRGRAGCQAYTQRAMINRLHGNDDLARADFQAAANLGSEFAKAQVKIIFVCLFVTQRLGGWRYLEWYKYMIVRSGCGTDQKVQWRALAMRYLWSAHSLRNEDEYNVGSKFHLYKKWSRVLWGSLVKWKEWERIVWVGRVCKCRSYLIILM